VSRSTTPKQQGHIDAQYVLGAMYHNGQGVALDYGKALHWLLKAAEQGHADAQYGLGLLYWNGHGLTRDYVKAHMWLNLATSRTNGDGYEKYSKVRDDLASEMTPQQISDAQRLAYERNPANPPRRSAVSKSAYGSQESVHERHSHRSVTCSSSSRFSVPDAAN